MDVNMDLKATQGLGHSNPPICNIRCPVCNHAGAFHGAPNVIDFTWQQQVGNGLRSIRGGVRICPRVECNAVVFVAVLDGKIIKVFPPEVIDFDSTNLPENVLRSLEEAIKCHGAECYKATALMVRRLLEELCENQNASGADLKSRLANLGKTVLIPQELLTAADELRLLGNDAAHVRAKDYDRIEKTEATIAVELAKELLKSVYQYAALVEKLKALKKPAP